MNERIFKDGYSEYTMHGNTLFRCPKCGKLATNHIDVRSDVGYDGSDYCKKHYDEKKEELENDKKI